MKNIDDFMKAQGLINDVARIRKELFDLGYNKSLKILPDFVECYARDRFNLKLENKKGYDGVDKDGKRYQVKYTILSGISKQGRKKFSHSLDNIQRDKFDYLIAVILDMNYSIIQVFKIPHDVVCKEGYLRGNSFRIEKVIEFLKPYEVSILNEPHRYQFRISNYHNEPRRYAYFDNRELALKNAKRFKDSKIWERDMKTLKWHLLKRKNE